MTAGEQLIERGRKEGLTTGQQQMLLTLLRTRFGAIPATAVARVQTADSNHLEAWANRVLTAASLDDVLDGA